MNIDKLFTSLARIEEQLYPNAVILPHFPRSIQLDYYSCGAKSTYMILKYYGKRCTSDSVEKQLGTDEDGTSPSDIKRVLRKYGLQTHTDTNMNLRDLKASINAGSPILVSLYDGWHYSVVYGYSNKHVFVMNPSSLKCAVGLSEWRRSWDRWGIIVNTPH